MTRHPNVTPRRFVIVERKEMRNASLSVSAVLLSLVAVLAAATAAPCRFAPLFNTSAIASDAATATAFLDTHAAGEAGFVRYLGVDPLTQLTYDGHRLDFVTGMPDGLPHLFSAPSKESLHVGLLARYLADQAWPELAPRPNRSAHVFASVDAALATLVQKADAIDAFNTEFPGFGGFMPWFAFANVTENGVNKTQVTPVNGWANRVPALDNGEFFWAAYAVRYVLQTAYPQAKDTKGVKLYERWHVIVERMVKNALTVFYAGDGNIRCVTALSNQSLPVEQNTYSADGGSTCMLNDPYEGELFTVLVDLLTDLPQAEKKMMWVQKRPKLQSVNLTVNASGSNVNITVQRGWWFSAHEQWKYIMLPYRRAQSNWAVFQNGERARTWYASAGGAVSGPSTGVVHPSPGMWASVTSPVTSNADNFDYFSACGVGPIAFETVQYDETITPYSSFPLLLLDDQRVGAAWLHNMISSRKGQNPFGTTESFNVTGTGVGSLCTWDSKENTLLSSLGGIADLNTLALGPQLTERFVYTVEVEWARVFPEARHPGGLSGSALPFQLPQTVVPALLPDYTACA